MTEWMDRELGSGKEATGKRKGRTYAAVFTAAAVVPAGAGAVAVATTTAAPLAAVEATAAPPPKGVLAPRQADEVPAWTVTLMVQSEMQIVSERAGTGRER